MPGGSPNMEPFETINRVNKRFVRMFPETSSGYKTLCVDAFLGSCKV